MNPYEHCPTYTSDCYLLRLVDPADAADLLKVYADERAVPLFNSDNCYGDDFHYRTLAQMQSAITFWRKEYGEGKYVRWTICDRASDEAIGTIELFNRHAADFFNDCGILRLDLRSDHERSELIISILSLILDDALSLFGCKMIATKCPLFASARAKALAQLGFVPTDEPLIGHDETPYRNYWIKR